MDGMVHGCVFFFTAPLKKNNYMYEIVKTIQVFGFVSKLRAAESGAPFGFQLKIHSWKHTDSSEEKILQKKREELAQHKAAGRECKMNSKTTKPGKPSRAHFGVEHVGVKVLAVVFCKVKVYYTQHPKVQKLWDYFSNRMIDSRFGW